MKKSNKNLTKRINQNGVIFLRKYVGDRLIGEIIDPLYVNTLGENTIHQTTLYTYDLWGNETEGYEVNNVFGTDITIDVPESISDEELLKLLAAETDTPFEEIEGYTIEGEIEFILYFLDENGNPAFELRNTQDI